jgi:hypothetical protein
LHLAGKIFRIGHLGYVTEDDIKEVLNKLKVVLPQAGFEVKNKMKVLVADPIAQEGNRFTEQVCPGRCENKAKPEDNNPHNRSLGRINRAQPDSGYGRYYCCRKKPANYRTRRCRSRQYSILTPPASTVLSLSTPLP